MWDEVRRAQTENRRELVLSGKVLSARMQENDPPGLDPHIFALTSLNFLDLSCCSEVTSVPDDLRRLSDLTTLLMNGNAIASVPSAALAGLSKLKVLDFSANAVASFPADIVLDKLTTLNLSINALTVMPSLEKFSQLAHVDFSGNQLTDMNFLCHPSLSLLAEISMGKNRIESIPTQVSSLVSLKKLDLQENQLKTVPGELADCGKLKELLLIGNPFSDNRLKKMVAQKGTKAVLDYVRQNCPRDSSGGAAGGGKKAGGKGKKGKKGNVEDEEDGDAVGDVQQLCDTLEVLHVKDGISPQVIATDLTKDVRPYFVGVIIRNVDLSGANFKKFIQLQTRLHDTVCDRRNAATIATHDLAKLPPGNLTYTAKLPKELKIIPLNQAKEFDGDTLVTHLRNEAEAVRKEKKRNTFSGVHQYLNMLNKKETYACLTDSQGRVVSFPPITNSDVSKISEETTDIFAEITSSLKLQTAKTVADELIREMMYLDLGKKTDGSTTEVRRLVVEQVKIVDTEGNLKVVYPSKTDLTFEGAAGGKILVKRP